MTRFPDEPVYQGNYAPMRVEADIYDLEVAQGEVPGQLDGTYYRVVADRQWPPLVSDGIPFNSDGMVMSFRFTRGHVDFKSRYVRTPRFEAERKARRALFGAYRNAFTDDPTVAGLNRSLANTNVFWHGGKLLAAKEDSPPFQLDPDTLDTVGIHTFDGVLTAQTSTAHPKFDPRTGEMVFFGYAAKGEGTPDIVYYEADPAGNLMHETWFQAPYPSMVHDFAVTQNFVIFPIIPLVSELDWLRQGRPIFAWDPDKDVYLGVLPRKGGVESLRWYRASNRFASHILGAYDDGRHIFIDTPVSETNYFAFFPDLSGAPYDPERTKGYLSRWTVDTAGESASFTEERLTDHAGEFPRMDDRFETLPYSWGVLGMYEVPGQQKPGGGFRWVGTVDLARGITRTHYVGDASTTGEPLFVPAHDGAAQGEGYVFAVVGRHAENRSDLLILDAQRIDAPPVATVKLPIRIPYGLHGNWVTTDELRKEVA